MLRSALAISILLVAGLGAMSQRTDASSRVLPSANLLGTWQLKAVGGKDPATIAIKSWQVEFREQGNWIYSGSMTGKWEGMKLGGSGTWSVQGNHLEYTPVSTQAKRRCTLTTTHSLCRQTPWWV